MSATTMSTTTVIGTMENSATARLSTGRGSRLPRTAHAARISRSSHRSAGVRGRRRPSMASVPLRQARTRTGAVPLRLTRRGRFAVVLLVAVVLLTGFSFTRTGTQASTTLETGPVVVQTTVQPGETLWTVATRVAPGNDPRETVQRLRQLNHLRGSGLQAGQQLLPADLR